MRHRPQISLVVPAYNEERRLRPTILEAVNYFRDTDQHAEIIVVDDGSRDRTSDVVLELADEYPNVRLIRLAANHGKGYAVRSGVMNADGDYVLFADADGATPIGEIDRLNQVMRSGGAIAIGSRSMASENVRVQARFYRRVIGRVFHALVSTLTVRGIHDTQCGFKMFRSDVAQDLFSRMRMNGFSFDVELLMMAQYCNYPIAEVPVNWTHQPGSRVNLFRDSLRMARDLFIIRAHAARGHYAVPHVARKSVAAAALAPSAPQLAARAEALSVN